MNPLVTIALIAGGALLLALFFGFQHISGQPNSNVELASTSVVLAQSDDIRTIRVELGDFFFEGPEGRSGAANKNDAIAGIFDPPETVLQLKNGEPVKLVFVNISSVVDHQVISPLFAMPEEKVFRVSAGQTVEIEVTPNFLDVQDGGTIVLPLTCHERHGQDTGHYKLGMQALIEIVP